MIFKVFYQPTKTEVPIRENTRTIYVEAKNERETRKKLVDREYNIEFVQAIDEKFLAYEQQSENFNVEKL